MWTKIKQLLCDHEWSKTRLATVGRGYESRRIPVPTKNAHCLICGKPATKGNN